MCSNITVCNLLKYFFLTKCFRWQNLKRNFCLKLQWWNKKEFKDRKFLLKTHSILINTNCALHHFLTLNSLWGFGYCLLECDFQHILLPFIERRRTAVAQSVESWASYRRTWVWGSPGENCHVHYRHQYASAGISMHLQASVCIYRHCCMYNPS